MASIKKRPDGAWRARFDDPSGREVSKHFRRKTDAQDWLDEQTTAVLTGAYVHPSAGKVKVCDYAASWRKTLSRRPSYMRVTDNALNNHILPKLGGMKLAQVQRSDVQGLVTELAAEVLIDKVDGEDIERQRSANSVHNVYRVLAQMFEAAVLDRRIAITPCVKIQMPSRPDEEVVPPTPDELAALVAATRERYRAVVVMLAGTGLRISEALGLRVGDINFLKREMQVLRQRDPRTNQMVPPKTKASIRKIPVGQIVIDELAAHLAAYPAAEDGSLFTNGRGTGLTYEQWKPVWKAAGTTFKTHDLRHFAASALIHGGASVKRVQAILGHSSPAITLKVYSHLWPDDDDRARTIMDGALEGCLPLASAGA